jgi:hypothetical protein
MSDFSVEHGIHQRGHVTVTMKFVPRAPDKQERRSHPANKPGYLTAQLFRFS